MARNRFFEDEIIHGTFSFKQLKRMLSYVIPYKNSFIITLILMVVTTVASLSGPYITKIIVDEMIPRKDIRGLIITVAAFVAIIITQIVLRTIYSVIMAKTGYSIIYDLRKELFSHMQTLSFDYYDNRPAGKILVRVTNYVDSLAGLLSDGIVNVIIDCVTLFAILFIMFSINPSLTFISIITCVPLSVIIIIFQRVMRIKWRRVNNKASNRTAYTHENIMGAKVIQAFTREAENQRIYGKLNEETKNVWLSAIKINNLFWPGVDIIGTLGIIFTYLLGFKLLKTGSVTVGTLIAFTGYIGRFWAPINNMSAIYNRLLTAMANTERIFETLDEKPEIKDLQGAEELPEIKGDVEFKNVTFGYDEGFTVLKNVSLRVKNGESIALVGPTGAGKTTIVNLISRFYDVNSGFVLIDGYNIKNVILKSLRKQMGIMLQDTFIFSGTIMENIRYGKLDATDEECIEAAKVVYAHNFISKLREGYCTVVDERGSSLSTGERQLLSFARTILADPRILILDEATSSIDTRTEQLVQKALQRLLAGRTSFIIAHRLSTIKNADRIMYVENNTIMESGSHNELIRLRGQYYNLYQSQYRFLESSLLKPDPISISEKTLKVEYN